MLIECGIQIAVITGRQSKLVDHRMNELGVKLVFQGYRDKRPALDELMKKTGFDPGAMNSISGLMKSLT